MKFFDRIREFFLIVLQRIQLKRKCSQLKCKHSFINFINITIKLWKQNNLQQVFFLITMNEEKWSHLIER